MFTVEIRLQRCRLYTSSKDVKIPQDLKDIVKEEDLDFLVDSAYNDACAPGNPKDATKEDIKALYQSLM